MRKKKAVARGQEPTLSRRQALRVGAGAAVAASGVAITARPVAASDHYDGWLDEVANYDGTIDLRERDEVRIEVGAGENGLLFDPAAILVDPDTTVVWEWTGEGGAHDVTTVEGPADLETEVVGDAGHVYEATFEADHEGITKYVCTPHEAVEMKGVVAVGVAEQIGDDLIEATDSNDGETGGGVPLGGLDAILTAIALGMAGILVLLPFSNMAETPETGETR